MGLPGGNQVEGRGRSGKGGRQRWQLDGRPRPSHHFLGSQPSPGYLGWVDWGQTSKEALAGKCGVKRPHVYRCWRGRSRHHLKAFRDLQAWISKGQGKPQVTYGAQESQRMVTAPIPWPDTSSQCLSTHQNIQMCSSCSSPPYF